MLKILLILVIVLIIVGSDCTLYWPRFNFFCDYRECCYDRNITGVHQLGEDLKTKVHGQPLILDPIHRSLMAHMINDHPSRPLVMYFSGWTGTGKTFVANLIAKNLFRNGLKSRFVKYISSSFHFPISIRSDYDIDAQRIKLRDMIRDVVSQCERSLIILDELDKLPAGVVDILQPLFDYAESVDGVQYRKAIFIFLSNTGANKLNGLSYKMFKEGKERKDLSRRDVEEILINESYEEPGGLRHSSLIKRYSIGVFIPFLPLERQHVRLCIRDKITELRYNEVDIEKLIDEIAEDMTYFPSETQMYSKSGCKGVEEKIINHLGPPGMQIETAGRQDL